MSDRFERYRERTRRDIERYNAQKIPSTDGIECKECGNKRFIAVPSEDGMSIAYQFCGCQERRRIVANANHSGLGPMLGKKIADYKVTEPFQQAVMNSMVDYIKNPSGWFSICGEPGSGKTLACMIIANDLLRHGKILRFISWPELVRETSVDWYRQKNILQEFKDVEVLYIDDFLKVASDARAVQIAYEILNYRYNHEALTIISGERGLKELMSIDPALGSRIYEMSRNHFIDIGHGTEKNQRMKWRKNESSNTDRQTDC